MVGMGMEMPLCRHWENKGFCTSHEAGKCKFTHEKKPAKNIAFAIKETGNKKMTLCRNYEEGSCPYGDRCNFAHGESDRQVAKNPLWKTTLCTNHQKGECTRGASACMFAHDASELREADKKVLTCRYFNKPGGGCRDGDSCPFKHDRSRFPESETNNGYDNQQDQASMMANPMMNGMMNSMMMNSIMQQNMGGNGYGGDASGFNGSGYGGDASGFNGSGYGDASGFNGSGYNGYSEAGGYGNSESNHNPATFKIYLCKRLMEEKTCRKGAACEFAHSLEEMRPLPPPTPGFKDTPCKYFEEDGKCKWGDKCKWAHGKKELLKHTIRPGQYKSICKQFVTKSCTYGINCSFSHEIPKANKDWKATKCKSGDECSFGSFCFYAHSDREIRTREENLQHMEFYSRLAAQQQMMEGGGGGGNGMMQAFNMAAAAGQANGGSGMMNQGYNMAAGTGQANGSGMVSHHSWSADMMNGQMGGGGGMSYNQQQSANMAGQKGSLCPVWLEEGACQDPACPFSHSKKEQAQYSHQNKRSFQEMSGEGSEAGRVANEPRVLDGKFKVVMCEKYTTGCDMGERCHYAHGHDELKYYRIKQVPNYKKTLCKAFDESGMCQWNMTCMFAHGRGELRLDEERGGGGGVASSASSALYYDHNKDYNHRDEKRMRF